jgi:hypothetical protein
MSEEEPPTPNPTPAATDAIASKLLTAAHLAIDALCSAGQYRHASQCRHA